jgi:hypothetical protein
MLVITPQTIIYDLLNEYPHLEDKLIEIAPIFIKLKNPVLRRTITKITSLRQASVVGNVPINDLVNRLREAAGQRPLQTLPDNSGQEKTPGWILDKEPVVTYDAREDLNNGIHPLGRIMREINTLQEKEVYKLVTAFIPAPLIEKVRKKGFNVWSVNGGDLIKTFIVKE